MIAAFPTCFDGNPVGDVMVGGRFVLRDGRHEDEAAIAAAYGKTLARLLD